MTEAKTKYPSLREVLRADFHRYNGATSLGECFIVYITEPGARFTFWLRLAGWLKTHPTGRLGFPFAWFMKHRYEIKFGFSLPVSAEIGPGLYFSHFGGIVVNRKVVIGRNCNIGHCVTIGQSNRGKRKGVPRMGDNVFIGPGAKIFGAIYIGNSAAIGANSVVTDDVPEGAVVAGIPAKVISMEGSHSYIEWAINP